ncbi:MAG: hypothetical protein A2Z24_01355 [Candidatus Woykebacteria bacterium RBG_16_44_10]|uniref:Uncharacterized protein n=1 Tax=Candidatus Woykebacteria bacterium RBG_16_44_10 TaxID=1802597 RepID=A0A1G1WES2_9BACT|nr:MAG: hypothetical protein A2Z24_01355 [Candidatus Woykebacteria bacterium RBG_16_44_10]
MPEDTPQVVTTISWPKVILTILIIVVVAGLIGGGLFWYFVVRQPTELTPTATNVATSSSKKATDYKLVDTTAWKTYSSSFKYQLKYPNGFRVYDGLPAPEMYPGTPPPNISNSYDAFITDFDWGFTDEEIFAAKDAVPADSEFFNIMAIEKENSLFKDKSIGEIAEEIYNENKDSPVPKKSGFSISPLSKTNLFGGIYNFSMNNSHGFSYLQGGFTLEMKSLNVICFERSGIIFNIIYKPSNITETILSTFRFD